MTDRMHIVFTVCLVKDGQLDIHRFFSREKANCFYLWHKEEPMILQRGEEPFKFVNLEFNFNEVHRDEYSADELRDVQRREYRAKHNRYPMPVYARYTDSIIGLTKTVLQEYDVANRKTVVSFADNAGHKLTRETLS